MNSFILLASLARSIRSKKKLSLKLFDIFSTPSSLEFIKLSRP
jgi:hypothetical protein